MTHITITCEELERRFILAVDKIIELRQCLSVREGGTDHSPIEAVVLLGTGLAQVHSILVEGRVIEDCVATIAIVPESRKGQKLSS